MSLTLEKFTEQDWLNRMYRKSESKRTKDSAITSLSMFDLFCKYQNLTKEQVIEKYQELFNQNKPDIRSICLSLDKFIQFLDQEHEEIILNPKWAPSTFKRKSPGTIKVYFGFVKSYLRICHGIKITTEDIQDYVNFPKNRKEPRRPISIEVLKKIFNNASPERRALYYTLVSSGMRISEALSLTKKNFHFDENPVRITLEADNTKTKEGRETYITSEAYEKLKPILEGKTHNELVFTNYDNVDDAVVNEEQNFGYLRKTLGMTEKYPNSSRYVVNLHCLRAYFHTKASQKHGSDYANALDGHGAYLKQYYREDPQERAKKYKELESSLFIESIQIESEKTKDKIIENLQSQMEKLQAKMMRIELLND